MATQKPDSPAPHPVPAPRSEALEAELAMLESILLPQPKDAAQPSPVDPPQDRGGTP